MSLKQFYTNLIFSPSPDSRNRSSDSDRGLETVFLKIVIDNVAKVGAMDM